MSEEYKMNPKDEACHELYVKWAIPHLLAMREAIVKFDGFSNMNMIPVAGAIYKEYECLVKTNPAYAEANEILNGIAPYLDESISAPERFTF